MILSGTVLAQTMNEDFESYSPGTYMGVASPDWSTWSGTTGGAEDCQVVDMSSIGGSQGVYFSTTGGGGPQDVIIDFGGAYNTGDFVFETDMYIESGNGAYFNFQGESSVGSVWSMNCQFVDDGMLYIDDGDGVKFTSTFPLDTWFTITFDINLSVNDWEVLVDGSSLGVVQFDYNQVASIDIYPVNSNYGGNGFASYYHDNIQFDHTPYVMPAINGAVTQITNTSGLSTQEITPSVRVRNLGTTTVTDFEVELSYDGSTVSETVTGVSLASGDYYDVDFTTAMTLIPGANVMTGTIMNVNGGGADDDASDDSKSLTLDPVVPAPGKMVWGEEATGTWCGWCPRGAVYMDFMEDTYGDFWEGVAVHNGDPMEDSVYDAGIGPLIGGYPSALVDRGGDVDPSGFEFAFLNRIVIPPTALIAPSATYDESTKLLTTSIEVAFETAATGTDYDLAFVISENDVTGTSSGYNQNNSYSGGGAGEMGGYEDLPSPVPASMMVYDHVARTIQPGFGGMSGIFPSSVAAGDTYSQEFEFTIPSAWDLEELHLIGVLINNSTGEVDNAGLISWEDVEIIEGEIDDASIAEQAVTDFELYPNPANEIAYIQVGDVRNENVSVAIFDLSGKLITSKVFGVQNGNFVLPIDVNYFESGMYSVQLTIGESTTTEKLIIE